jgi:spore coat polysaccharide biosynthesis predicted glycosyltransferase SpsG
MWLGPLLDSFDWLVIDLPDEAPGWLYDHCQDRGIKTCILNGVGHQVGDRATLRIVQGLGEGQYSGVDYIILRDSVFQAKKARNPIVEWFVFGGAADKMGLTQKFPNWQRMVFTISDEDWQAADNHDNGFLLAASQCKKACVAMGMTVLELASWGDIPVYVFSVSETHLKFAKGLEEAGYAKVYPKVGLPDNQKEFLGFLSEPFKITGKPIDGRACERILGLMK